MRLSAGRPRTFGSPTLFELLLEFEPSVIPLGVVTEQLLAQRRDGIRQVLVRDPVAERTGSDAQKSTDRIDFPDATGLVGRADRGTAAEAEKMPVHQVAEAVVGAVLWQVFRDPGHGFPNVSALFAGHGIYFSHDLRPLEHGNNPQRDANHDHTTYQWQ